MTVVDFGSSSPPFRVFIGLKEENVETQVTLLVLEACFKISPCL